MIQWSNVNRLFVLPFARNTEGDNKDYFSHYYVPNVEIKDFNVLIDGKRCFFFYLPVKNEEETYEKIIEMRNNNDYTTGNLLDFVYYKKNYKLIAIDLSKQIELKDSQQINFIGKHLTTRGATMFFIIEKSEKTTLNFSKNCKFAKWFWQWKLKICNKKWYIIESELKGNYSHHDPIKFLTKSIESSRRDYSDAYI